MDAKAKARYEAQAKIIRAMAHPTRLFILDELKRQERCVYELTEIVGADMSTISKHLSILKGAGIVKIDKRGTQIYYQLKVPCILEFVQCVEHVLKANAKEHLALVL